MQIYCKLVCKIGGTKNTPRCGAASQHEAQQNREDGGKEG